MTPEQQRIVQQLRRRVLNMRAGGARDKEIFAGLISEGWPTGAVIQAMED